MKPNAIALMSRHDEQERHIGVFYKVLKAIDPLKPPHEAVVSFR
jgi:hypothetical protein